MSQAVEDPRIVDARGHRCPAPTLRLRRALESAAPGQRVRLLADDPMARIDVPYFVADAGHLLVETTADGSELQFLVEKR
jgi:tRNA 2-thiouridine synthesizing protein A